MARSRRMLDTLVVVLAVASRVAAIFVLQSHHVPRSTYEHGEIATNLLAGNGFSMHFLGAQGPTSQQAPLYPTLVALAYAAGGVDTPRALLLLELGQAVLGGVLVLGALCLARLVAPGRSWLALTAALLVALHPTLVYAATHVQVATLGATLLVWTLVWAYRTGASGQARDAAIAGGLLALLALSDPILALVAPGVAYAIWQGRDGAGDRLIGSVRLTAVMATVGLAGISPWLVRNARVHGEFVPIKSTLGYAFWQGNCKLSEGTDKVVRASVDRILGRNQNHLDFKGLNRTIWEARHEAGYLDDLALSQADYRRLGAVSEPERSRILLRRALFELSDDPWRYLRLCLRRLKYFVLFDETNPKSRVLAYRLPHVGLSVLAAIGLFTAGAALRRRLAPTLITVAAITVFHSLTIVSARFHIPIEPLLALWAAAGVTALWRTGRSVRLTSTRYDVKRVGVEGRFGGGVCGVGGSGGVGFLPGAKLHDAQDEARDEGTDADHEGASPDDAVSSDRVATQRRIEGQAGRHDGADHRDRRHARTDRRHRPPADRVLHRQR